MTQSLSDVAVKQFSDNFMNTYQAKVSLIKDTVQVRRGVTGNAYEWKIIGGADLNPRTSPSSKVPQDDVTHVPKIASKLDFILGLPSDIFQQAEVNASERDALAREHANAIARREDLFVINALNASTTTNTIAAGGANMTLDKIIETAEFLNENNVDGMGRHFAIHSSQLSAMLKLEKLTSSDYNNVKALVAGEINTFMGFIWHVFGNRFHHKTGANMGLPKTGNDRTCFAWHNLSAGVAYYIDPVVTIDWDPTIQSWVTISKMSAGSIPILDEGIVKIVCTEPA